MSTSHCKDEIPFAREVARCRGRGQNGKWKEPRPSEQGEVNTGGNARVSPDESQQAQRGARRWTGTGPTPQSDLAVRDCKYIIRGRASRHPRRQAMMRVVLRLALDDWKRWNIPVQRREHGAAQSGNDH